MVKCVGKTGPKPKFICTDDVLIEAKSLAAYGLTQDLIGNFYGYISEDGWDHVKKRHPELKKVMKIGKAKAIANIAQRLYDKANSGDTTCMIFYLKTQAHFRETLRLDDISQPKSREHKLTITCTDPVEASREYQKIMKGE